MLYHVLGASQNPRASRESWGRWALGAGRLALGAALGAGRWALGAGRWALSNLMNVLAFGRYGLSIVAEAGGRSVASTFH